MEETRLPRYAGSWYEADPNKLNYQMDDLLSSIDIEVKPEKVLAAIAPHAGLRYSGRIAGYSYKAFENQEVERLFLIGPSHHIGFYGAALPTASIFATPIGEIVLDQKAIRDLQKKKLFVSSSRVHEIEHSLELHLPFIAKILKKTKIVPIIIGTLKDESDMAVIVNAIKENLTDRDAVVVSSDFIHYGPRYDYMPFGPLSKKKIREIDMLTFQFLSKGDLKGLLEHKEYLQLTICGINPCALLCCLLPQSFKSSLLQYGTSNDVYLDDQENLVSYMSIAFYGDSWQYA
jgi:AmmeMemoRadiSam system protein B